MVISVPLDDSHQSVEPLHILYLALFCWEFLNNMAAIVAPWKWFSPNSRLEISKMVSWHKLGKDPKGTCVTKTFVDVIW